MQFPVRLVVAALLVLWCFASLRAEEPEHYFPDRWDWQSKSPEELGFDPAALQKAVDFAKSHETPGSTDVAMTIRTSIAGQPHDEIIGPTKSRGGNNGLILRHGYIAAEWGDTSRVDMTFSATKSYLATTAGLALDRGLIENLGDPAAKYVPDELFASPHNSKITWHMLLNQTSEWEGTLWGKPDWAPSWNGTMRTLNEPGTRWEYNDVRVNCLALALLHVWRRPLPQVLREHVMDPIGASNTWRWHGYENSWVDIDGAKMQSVSGGGHWGGGLQISTRDHARFGYLFLRRGRWNDQQLISEKWIDLMTKPTDIKPTYGYLWWVNAGGQRNDKLPESSFSAVGAGTNVVWIDPEHDVVAVTRWINPQNDQEFLELVAAAVRK